MKSYEEKQKKHKIHENGFSKMIETSMEKKVDMFYSIQKIRQEERNQKRILVKEKVKMVIL